MADGRASINQQAAAREVLRRRRARSSLVDYSQSITIPGAPMSEDADEWLFKPIESAVAKHHIITMLAIERCIRTDYGRLMIFEPPGSAKSTYASVVGPTWAMGAFPGIRVLMTSYAATPIIRHSKRARQIVASKEYQAIWEQRTALIDGSKAADEFELTTGSGLFAAGLLGGLTSSRCDLGIIDDPVAGREEADSETIRIKTRAAFEDDFLTRLKPKASVILIQTRWHENDLAGSILPEDYKGQSGAVLCRDGQVWEVLNLPARCERADDPVGREIGEYLWPEWFNERHWLIYERNPRTWASLYQQRPSPPEGTKFARKDFQRYELGQHPKRLNFYMATDWALTDKETSGTEPDFTEHGVFGVDSTDDIWIVAWWGNQKELDESTPPAIGLVADWKPQRWFGERGGNENSAGPYVRAEMRRRKTYCARELLPSVQDKVAKASAFAGRVGARTVHVPNCDWGDALIEQLCSFPAGRYDDKVDVCGLIGRGLDMMYAKSEPQPETRKQITPFTRAWLEHNERADEAKTAEFYS